VRDSLCCATRYASTLVVFELAGNLRKTLQLSQRTIDSVSPCSRVGQHRTGSLPILLSAFMFVDDSRGRTSGYMPCLPLGLKSAPRGTIAP
jgi:hypothetical protein